MILEGLLIPIISFTVITIFAIVTGHALIQNIIVWDIEGIKFGTMSFLLSSISLVVMTHISIKNRRLLFH